MSGIISTLQSARLAPPASIVSLYTGTGIATVHYTSAFAFSGCRSQASGALTANTLATQLSVVGRGMLFQAAALAADVTSRTLRMVLTIDGNACIDVTSAAISATDYGLEIAGSFENTTVVSRPLGIPFDRSCLLQVASSLTETDKFNIYFWYWTA